MQTNHHAGGITFAIYHPPDLSKRWFVQYYSAGERIRIYKGINIHTTHAERMKAARRLIDHLATTLPRPVSDLEQKVSLYIAAQRSRWRLSTLQAYQTVSKKFFSHLDNRRLTVGEVEAFFHHLASTRHPSTFNRYRIFLKRLLEAQHLYGLFENIPQLTAQSTPARYFQRHQIHRLRDHFLREDPQLWRFVCFIYYCFIRPRELRELRAGDVELDEQRIFIRAEISKNKKSQYVTIPDDFLPGLQWIYELPPAQLLFHARRSITQPIGRNTMTNRHREHLKNLRFGPGYQLYSWKHTGAVNAIKNGVGVKELQIQLRHHSLDETDKYLRQLGVGDLVFFKQNFKMP
jgi:integrase